MTFFSGSRSSLWRGEGGLRRFLSRLLLSGIVLLSLCLSGAALAHDPYETTTKVFVRDGRIDVTMIMARRTAEELFGAENVPVSGAPWVADSSLDELYVLTSGGELLELRSSRANEVLEGKDQGDFVFEFEYSPSPGHPARLRAAYLEKLEQGYTGVVQVVEAESSNLLDIKVLHSADPFLEFTVPVSATAGDSERAGTAARSSVPRARPLWTFLWVGIEHVVFGYDHLLFLLGVLFACVGWRQALGILTTFTLAHSVTLSLAALDVIPLVNDVVEPVIAASIFVAAFWGKMLEARGLLLPMTFVFGLIHGLGFAAGLEALADSGDVRVLGLLGFNLGVELGQIVAAVVLLPVLTSVRRSINGETALHWAARGVGVTGAAIFAWRIVGWG